MNCWEFMKCSEEARAACPAYLEDKGLDCWKVTRTMCNRGEQRMATLEEKMRFCKKCEFYQRFAHRY